MRCTERLLTAGLCLLSAALCAAQSGPTLEITVPATAVAVGDPLTLRVQARGGDDGIFGELEVAVESGGPWELLEGPRPVAGSRPPAWEVVLAPMSVGEIELPTFEATVRGATGEVVKARALSPPKAAVASVLAPDGSTEPAPLRDPIGARGLPWEWIPPLLALASPLVAAGLLWLRRRRAGSELAVVVLSPAEELRRAAAELAERIGRQPAEGVCDGLATAVRRYLERRTGEPALEMTSFEIRRVGRDRGWPEDTRRSLQRLLETADGVRFGRRPATATDLAAALEAALAAAVALEDHLRPAADDTEEPGVLAS